jgi:hypothetical protein
MKSNKIELPNLNWEHDQEITALLNDLNDILSVFAAQVTLPSEVETPNERVLNDLEKFSLRIPLLESWIRESPQELDPFIQSALFLYWFEILYRKDDDPTHLGSLLAESFVFSRQQKNILFTSLGVEIIQMRFQYWNLLRISQSQNHEISEWLKFYLRLFLNLLQSNFEKLSLIHFKNDYLRLTQLNLNERQLKFMSHVLDLKNSMTEIKITNDYVVHFSNCSRETAKRDLAFLVKKNLILKIGAGRSVSYVIKN